MTDAVVNVDREIERVLSKFTQLSSHASKTLNDLINLLENLHRDLVILTTSNDCELTGIQTVILNQNIKKIRDIITGIAMEHRDLHGTVSKVGKAIDKNFISDFACVNHESLFEDTENSKIMNQVIVEHFLRQGMLEIADEVTREAKLEVSDEKKQPFTELNRILDALKMKNLEPALEWAIKNREKLKEQNSCLEFKLHRLQFIELLRGGVNNQIQLINYSRSNFQSLACKHEKDVQTLMGSLIYLKVGITNSPYNYLLDTVNWGEICDIFTRDACALLGLSVDSPLSVTIGAGCVALPALLNIKQVMQQRQVTSVWNTRDELPIEIDLSRKCHFHSIFACPILRQQGSENNPPMRLICGHVISRDALNKLSNGNKLKCPYCPIEQNPSEARLIHF